MSAVHTWADNYGVWHASMPEHAYAQPAAAARRAIRRELSLREGPRFDPRVIGVRLHEVADRCLVYREAAAR